MSRIVKIILAVNLIAFAVLVFVYPNLMVGPGKLIPGQSPGNRLFCLSCPADRCAIRALRHLPQARRNRSPIDERPAHRQTADLDAVPPEAGQRGLRGVP